MKAEWRTMQPGTARKPALRKRAGVQPLSFESTLSHQTALPGPPAITLMSLSRNESSTAFFSHWLTCQAPSAWRSATRALPLSSRSRAAATALRTAPLVFGPIVSRWSKASSMVLASLSCMALIAPETVIKAGGLSGQGAALSSGRRRLLRRRTLIPLHQCLQETGEIVGDMVDVGGFAPFELPVFAEDVALRFRHHQHGGHAERMRRFQIARQVLEHGGAGRIDVMLFEEALVIVDRRLRLELGRHDIEHV